MTNVLKIWLAARNVWLARIRLARLTELLREREPFYLEIADVIINTDDLPMKKVVDRICRSLESQ